MFIEIVEKPNNNENNIEVFSKFNNENNIKVIK